MGSDIRVKHGILTKKYHLGKRLGSGSFSKVHHGRNLETGERVAIKILKKKEILAKLKSLRYVETEISAMKKLRHPNIVQFHEAIEDEKRIYIVMEYVEGNPLDDKMEEEQEPDEETKRKYFQQLISAVEFCHSNGVYHRDLKPENLIIDDNDNVKVIDFGLSAMKENAGEDRLFRTKCGTIEFKAPEVINGEPYDGAKADIWSCGVILFYLVTGLLPFDGDDLKLYRKMCDREFSLPSEPLEEKVASLLYQMLDPNTATRITIPQIMGTSWLQGIAEPHVLH